MPKDIREILSNEPNVVGELSAKHREKFEERLSGLKTHKKRRFLFLKIAAGLLILISLGTYISKSSKVDYPIEEAQPLSLASISPEMKQIENYYLTAINYELASIETSDSNREILDSYLEKIAALTKQYKTLNQDLQKNGINEKTINALIDNLQLRLQILLELKDVINDMKTPKTTSNEKSTI